MATPRKRKVTTVADESYSKLDQYCIWLNEYYNALLRAGFKQDVVLGIITDKFSYPSWVQYKLPSDIDIQNYLEEEED